MWVCLAALLIDRGEQARRNSRGGTSSAWCSRYRKESGKVTDSFGRGGEGLSILLLSARNGGRERWGRFWRGGTVGLVSISWIDRDLKVEEDDDSRSPHVSERKRKERKRKKK